MIDSSSFFFFALIAAIFIALAVTLLRARINMVHAIQQQRTPRRRGPAKVRPELWDVFVDMDAGDTGEGEAWDVMPLALKVFPEESPRPEPPPEPMFVPGRISYARRWITRPQPPAAPPKPTESVAQVAMLVLMPCAQRPHPFDTTTGTLQHEFALGITPVLVPVLDALDSASSSG